MVFLIHTELRCTVNHTSDLRYPLYRKAWWAPGPVWMDAWNFAPTGIRSPGRPVRSKSLYRLDVFFFSKCPDRLWGPLRLVFQGYRVTSRVVKLTTHLHLTQRLGMSGTIPTPHPHPFTTWTATLPLCLLGHPGEPTRRDFAYCGMQVRRQSVANLPKTQQGKEISGYFWH